MGIKDSYSVGIDFGTSNLKAGVYDGRAKIQKLSRDISGKKYEPNIITRSRKKDGSYFFEIGNAAQKALTDIDAYKMKFVYNVKKHLCEEKWEATFHDGLKADAVELSGVIFGWINSRIVAMRSGILPDKTVITVPVTYSEMQTGRIRRAAEMADIRIDAVISEPVAAFFSFDECKDFIESDEEDEEKYTFILDFGGGTIDAALIKFCLENGRHKISVLSSSGIKYGGSDLTNAIIEQIIYPSKDKKTAEKLKNAGYKFYNDVDTAKIRMFVDEEEEADDCFILNGEGIDYAFSEKQINDILDGLSIKSKLLDMIDSMLEEADLDEDEDDISVHFIGGGSCVPYFRNMLEEYFDTELDDYDDDETSGYVAEGAAFYAGMLSENKSIDFENRSAYQIVGEADNSGIYLNRNALFENKTSKKPLAVTFINGGKYMKFYQRFGAKTEKIYLGYLNLSDRKYESAVLFDLKIRYDGRIEAEIYGQSNESLGCEIIITEEL